MYEATSYGVRFASQEYCAPLYGGGGVGISALALLGVLVALFCVGSITTALVSLNWRRPSNTLEEHGEAQSYVERETVQGRAHLGTMVDMSVSHTGHMVDA